MGVAGVLDGSNPETQSTQSVNEFDDERRLSMPLATDDVDPIHTAALPVHHDATV
jgi:hypothetical protein